MAAATDTELTVPPTLVAELRAAADEEQRSPLDVLRDAVERYMDDRAWAKILAEGEARARALGLDEADVPRLIAESRQERRLGQA